MQMHKLVLFPHPCDEHSVPDKVTIKEWNTSRHYRKFMMVDGEYVAFIPKDSQEKCIRNGEITFWGEWESESSFTFIDDHDSEHRNEGLPKVIHTPKCFKNDIYNDIAEKRVINEKKCIAFFQKKNKTRIHMSLAISLCILVVNNREVIH